MTEKFKKVRRGFQSLYLYKTWAELPTLLATGWSNFEISVSIYYWMLLLTQQFKHSIGILYEKGPKEGSAWLDLEHYLLNLLHS